MKMKHTLLAALSALTILTAAGCSDKEAPKDAQQDAQTGSAQQESTAAPAAAEDKAEEKFTLKYPQEMKDLGYTEDLVLDKVPERVAAISTYPVMTLYELGVDLVGVPSTKVIEYPADLDAEQFPNLMSEQFDLELVVSLEPDLVILPVGSRDTHEKTLKELGIPTYSISTSPQGDLPLYQVIKNQTKEMIDAFAVSEEQKAAGAKIMERFADAEKKVEEVRKNYEGKKVMVLMASDPTSQNLQGENGTLGSMMAMLGFENVYQPDPNGVQMGAHNSVPLDMESALEYHPDLIVFTGSGDKAAMEELVQKTIAQNEAYWNSIEAIRNKQYIALPSNYVSTAGTNIINNILDLIEILEAHYAN